MTMLTDNSGTEIERLFVSHPLATFQGMEQVDLARRTKNFHGYTHTQELDLIELGERAARAIKGENRDRAERIIVGRARRGMRSAHPFRIRTRSAWWTNW